MASSTPNVHSKSLTSSIFFKFCGRPHLAIQWWHENFENNRITFRVFFGRFSGVTLRVYPKSRKNSHNFPTALVPSIIILQLFFSYQIKDLGLNISKHPISDFYGNWSKYLKNSD